MTVSNPHRFHFYGMVFVTLLVMVSFTGGWSDARAAPLPTPAPSASFLTPTGTHTLAEYRGQKVMVWMFSTWCSSCAAAFEALSEEQPKLKQVGLKIIALKNFENGGYPGPSLNDFVKQFGPTLCKAPNWTFGTVTAQMAQTYNPRRYPDIYFLIDEQGVLQAVEGAPGATMATITKFVGVN